MDAEKMTRAWMRRLIIGSSFFRGGLRITSWSTGSTPSDWLGGPDERRDHERAPEREGDIPSMRMLMNRICIALSGLLSPNIVLRVISVSAAAAVLSWKDRKF